MAKHNPRLKRKPKKKRARVKLSPKVKKNTSATWRWWNDKEKAPSRSSSVKWNTLEHNGPVFAPEYRRVPKNVKFYYNGNSVRLSAPAEEVAGFYGRMLGEKYTKSKIFNRNFFQDWQKVMTSAERNRIKDLSKCDFSDFYDFYAEEVNKKKCLPAQEKARQKKDEERLKDKYGHCTVDGRRQKITNFKLEPPGLFRGRGKHPKMGRLKARIQPEDVTINIGRRSVVPKPPRGHKWGSVIHDNTVCWLARWTENIFSTHKYIMLNPSSRLKGQREIEKFETARYLRNRIARIRKNYTRDLTSSSMETRQRAVALYFIDRLALRAGNEKGEDTADTVGCCSLRVEHVRLSVRAGCCRVHLDFPGKDSIRYRREVPVEKKVHDNLQLFLARKRKGSYLFDLLNASKLNRYLNGIMEGLTAKVFRTYNASIELEAELKRLTKRQMSLEEKVFVYNDANRVVAILCNHKRAVPKTYKKSLKALEKKLNDKMKQVKKLVKEMGQKEDSKRHAKKVLLLRTQIAKLELQAKTKKTMKDIALGTSKTNYLDPRITVAWCKRWDVPIEKIYNKTQRERFQWAIETTDTNFKF